MILYTSVEQQPEPQHEFALVSLSCKAISEYFCLTMSFTCSCVSIVFIVLSYRNITMIISKKKVSNNCCHLCMFQTFGLILPGLLSILSHLYNNKLLPL